MKTVHSFDYATGRYLGPVVLTEADMSPLEPGVYLVPGNCVELEPPAYVRSDALQWGGSDWVVIDLPQAVEESPAPVKTIDELNAEVSDLRANAYRTEVDPLYFKWQRGEATKESWLEAIAAIKERYPKATQTGGENQ